MIVAGRDRRRLHPAMLFRHPGLLVLFPVACASAVEADQAAPSHESVVPGHPLVIKAGKPVADVPGEVHLRNVRQLTFDGENAEAYWSNDGRRLIWQRTQPGAAADQIYILDLETSDQRMVSTGTGRTTCSYFMQGDKRILFASTHHFAAEPPVVAKPTKSGYDYLWAVHREYDLFTADPDGKNLKQITDTPGYDAEGTVDPVSGAIVFTSARDGDLEIYTCDADGSDVRRITNRPGYDGGAYFSHDGSKLVLRSAYPKDEAEAADDVKLLAQQLVRPLHMEITVCKRDGSGFRKVTDNGAANFGPYWHPDDKRIIFSSNVKGIEAFKQTGDHAQMGNFDLFLVREDGTGMEQVTFSPVFDGFPMFSPDGRFLVFASNRFSSQRRAVNIFVAEWVEHPGDR
jgi:Tol biopolymer transport system component